MNNQLLPRLSSILVLVNCLLMSATHAVTPPPDGGYSNQNTAEGEDALFKITHGDFDTAVGYHALHNEDIGYGSTAVGSLSLSNTSGSSTGVKIAIGYGTLLDSSVGQNALGVGYQALANYGSFSNGAIGHNAVKTNTNGFEHWGVGSGALQNHTATGALAFGSGAMQASVSGSNNVAFGRNALYTCNGSSNVAIGAYALDQVADDSSNKNIAIGSYAGHALLSGAESNIDIGNKGVAGDSHLIRIGDRRQQQKTYIAGISGTTVTGAAVVINSSGQLGIMTSSAQYKEAIKSMSGKSRALFELKPVKFRYKQELDPEGIPQFGLVAEQVEKVAPDLVVRDGEGKPYSVRYQAVNAMMLNEFQRERQAGASQDAALERNGAELDQLEATIARIQEKIAQ